MKKLLIIISLIFALLLLFRFSWGGNLSTAFNDAYPEDISPSGTIVEQDITASPSEITINGDNKIAMWTYNNQYPGPEIRMQLGDTLRINFTNSLPQETTIHFHGIRVPNAMDGVPGVTQDPIQPGDKFIYEFTPKDAGTYWYHPHIRSSEQIERGLIGTIIVEDVNEPKYDFDKTIVLDDILLDESGQIYGSFNTGHDLSHDGRWGNLILANGDTNPTYEVLAGSRIRLRFVNASNGRVYKMNFGDLNAKGFAVDGLLASETFNAQGFELSPGNRLDVDITLPSISSNKSYPIRDNFTRNTNSLFIIQPAGGITTKKDFATPTAKNFPEWENAIEHKADNTYLLNARRGGKYGVEWTINNEAFPNTTAIHLKSGQFNKIRFVNESSRLHPMHLHGQFFMVLTRNNTPASEPFFRDTVLIGPKETVDIGLVPLDKGEWANHCHILEHAEAGMMTTVIVD